MSTNDEPLAIDGGPPAVTAGPFAWPPADEAVRAALDAAFREGDWGRYEGSRCAKLRRELAAMHGVEHVRLTCSGTLAVELALRALGVAAGDGVLLAAYDFPGNFRAVERVGARPVLCDIAADAWTIDLPALEAAAGDRPLEGVRAVIVSHLHGCLAPMRRVMDLAAANGWAVVEDACQSPGAVVDERPAGAWGDVGVMSFGGSKLLTAGRGGALLMSDAAVAQRATIYAARGNDAFALSELQAAVLSPQLETLAARNKTRAERAGLLRGATSHAPGLAAPRAASDGDAPAYYKLGWRALSERLRSTCEEIGDALRAEGAPIDRGFRGFGKRSPRRCLKATPTPNADRAAAETLVLHHPALLAPPHAVEQIATAVGKVLAHHAID